MRAEQRRFLQRQGGWGAQVLRDLGRIQEDAARERLATIAIRYRKLQVYSSVSEPEAGPAILTAGEE